MRYIRALEAVPLISKYADGRIITGFSRLKVEESTVLTVKATPGFTASKVMELLLDVTVWFGKRLSNQADNVFVKLFMSKAEEAPLVIAV